MVWNFCKDLDVWIEKMVQFWDKFDGCIGCGCFSMVKCWFYNVGDVVGCYGCGFCYLMGDVLIFQVLGGVSLVGC